MIARHCQHSLYLSCSYDSVFRADLMMIIMVVIMVILIIQWFLPISAAHSHPKTFL
jgi:hypothetical protein